MEEGTDGLEDGEIIETETCNTSSSHQFSLSQVTREPKTICSEESSNDNSENSDDDSDAQCSKPKRIKSQSELPVIRKQVPNKYKVWSIALQEETLTETLTKCDVEAMDRERSVESYNYKLVDNTDYSHYSGGHTTPVSEHHYLDNDFLEYEEKQVMVGSKRRHRDTRKRRGYRKRFSPHCLPNLTVTAEDSEEEVAEDIALKLREHKRSLILNVVLVLGKEKAIDLYNETKGVEDNGGLLLMNGERRRTSGGVYLLLLKRDDSISSEAMKKIFSEELACQRKRKRTAVKARFKKKQDEIKETLIREKLLSLNTAAFVQSSETKELNVQSGTEINSLEEGEVELTVTNPPPSPATDQDTPPSRTLGTYSEDEAEHDHPCSVSQPENSCRPVVSYDDDENDFLEVNVDVDNMDLF